jgi:23S rRNA G2445 N2-methylase RlmL
VLHASKKVEESIYMCLRKINKRHFLRDFYMNIFVLCQKETVAICHEDIQTLTGKQAVNHQNWCELKDSSAQAAARLCYQAQSAHRIGILLARTNTLEELEQQLRNQTLVMPELQQFITQARSFRVKAIKHDMELSNPESKMSSVDIAQQIGGATHAFLEGKLAVDMQTRDLPLLVVITPTEVLFGIDCIGDDLARRSYKIFSHPASVNGVVAYSSARLSGVKKKSVVLDPFCDCATIPIETALWQTGSSPFLFERKFLGLYNPVLKDAFESVEKELKEIVAEKKENVFAFEPQLKVMLQAKKNIKLSGMHEQIMCSKVATDWIDAKFDENSVDCIVSKPPQISKRNNAVKQIKKVYDELFYQARHILKPKGTMGLLMHHPEHIEEFATKHQFKITNTYMLFGGKQTLSLVVMAQVKK